MSLKLSVKILANKILASKILASKILANLSATRQAQFRQKGRFKSLQLSGLKRLLLWGAIALLFLSYGWSYAAQALDSAGRSPIAPGMLLAQNQPSLDQLQEQQKQVEQQRSQLNQQRNQVEKKENSAQRQLGQLRHTIKATSEQVKTTEDRLQNANQKLNNLQASLNVAEKQYEDNRRATVARLKFLQRQQKSQGWAVLLQSENLNEFLDRRYQLRRVYGRDRQTLQSLKAASQTLESQRTQVALQRNEIDLLRQQLLTQKAEYQEQAKMQQASVDRLRQDKRALKAAEDQLAKDSTSLADLIQQRLAAQRARLQTGVQGNGLFAFPCDGPITSPFGYRIHPILGYSRFHGGVDFGADYGTPIRAAEAGVVLYSGWYGGFGQTIIIGHNSTTSTLYAHASELYVSEGETVQRGQVISAVGSTGFSTGPHLHFEVRIDGEPVDPLPYL